nr:MFS transporter [Fischerella thermalis]
MTTLAPNSPLLVFLLALPAGAIADVVDRRKPFSITFPHSLFPIFKK